ncbi:MAG: DUF1499 domain-containing protein [Cyanobacteria bacterium P01_A01_bin.114]
MPIFSFSGKRPTNLGVKQGQLLSCPESPNCVSSQADASDQEHFIAPIETTLAPSDAIAKLKAIIEGMERSQINEATDDYLYVEFASKLMGFVDDMEFYVDPASGMIQVRSAARLGRSDLGVNRKRVETIREQFQSGG